MLPQGMSFSFGPRRLTTHLMSRDSIMNTTICPTGLRSFSITHCIASITITL
jgi:hypothetical protein